MYNLLVLFQGFMLVQNLYFWKKSETPRIASALLFTIRSNLFVVQLISQAKQVAQEMAEGIKKPKRRYSISVNQLEYYLSG